MSEKQCRKCGGRGFRRVDIGSSLDRTVRCECKPDNRFYREKYATHMPSGVPIKPLSEYRDEFNTTHDAEEGYTAAVRLATVLMQKHWPEVMDWQPAPDLPGVITQLDHITAQLIGCFAGPVPEQTVSTPPAADVGAPCTLADRAGTSATPAHVETVARAIAEARHGAGVWNERNMNEVEQKDFRHQAQAAIAALARVSADCRPDRFANDAAAKALYDTWSDQPGWVPWVERGNSLMQSKARQEVTP